ncbi:MAG: V-type ATP synthase subunit I [Patescibacteria group bacterium]|nr:V-type ATP synthase subunit I [Patescibacteria group bacterium]
MAVANMTKIGILAAKQDEEKILEALYDFGSLQIIAKDSQSRLFFEEVDKLSRAEYEFAQVKFALNFIAQHKPEVKLSFRDKLSKMFAPGIDIDQKGIDKLLADFDYLKIVGQIEDLGARLNLVNLQINQLKGEIAELLPWHSLGRIQVSQISDRLQFKLGTIATGRGDDFSVEKIAGNLPAALSVVSSSSQFLYLSLAYLKEAEKEVNDSLEAWQFKEIVLPDYSASPAELIKQRQEKLNQLSQETEGINKQIKDLCSHEKNLKIIHDYLLWQKDKQSARVQADESLATFYLKAWIDKSSLADLQALLAKQSDKIHIDELTIAEDEEPPVLLNNKGVVKPFESVTSIYGAPKPEELDPTPYLAPFFIVFFGLCLSDAGYGLLLTALAALAIKLMRVPRHKQGMFRLLMYAGLSTFMAGVLFGSYFGIVIADLPDNFIKSTLLGLQIIDPVKNPLVMLVFALILGGVQIITGLIINAYYQFIRRDWGKLFDVSAWLFLMFGIVFWLISGQALANAALASLGKYWIYAATALLVLTQGRRSKNIFLKIPMGVLSLYGLVGYFSDIMSYSRLLALGLSTGIIAMVVNIVAFLFKDMAGFIGWPVAISILLGGHLFNLAINALGSFIHSGRLQYVEFFPKFMEGGGEKFKPLVKTAKYIDIYKES